MGRIGSIVGYGAILLHSNKGPITFPVQILVYFDTLTVRLPEVISVTNNKNDKTFRPAGPSCTVTDYVLSLVGVRPRETYKNGQQQRLESNWFK